MKRILFVDDEPRILEGLENMLRRHRRTWQMVFALGGQAGVDALDQGPFDVVVSDMRMPGVDGAALLRHAQQVRPGAVRMVLSGYTDLEATMRVVPMAHQFLSKPCSPDKLAAAVEQACALGALVGDEALRRLIGGIDRLPSLPQTYAHLSRVLEDGRSGAPEVAKVLAGDMAMSAKVLQLVNSAFFGLGRRITGIEEAVVLLGVNILRHLVLAVEVFDAQHCPEVAGFSLAALERHARLAAAVAGQLAPAPGRAAEDAFAGALLHDLGKVVVAMGRPELFAEAHANAMSTGRPSHRAERNLWGVTHAEVGAYLLGIWGLPPTVIDAVAHHHAPSPAPPPGLDGPAVVYLANALAHEAEAGAEAALEPLDEAYVARLGATERLAGWRAMARERRALLDAVREEPVLNGELRVAQPLRCEAVRR